MLKDLTLSSLGETKLDELFREALTHIENSLDADKDIKGKRSISISLAFEPNEHGYISVDMSVRYRTPEREVKTIATLEDSSLKIDTVSGDARQPDLYDAGAGDGKVIDLKKRIEGGTS